MPVLTARRGTRPAARGRVGHGDQADPGVTGRDGSNPRTRPLSTFGKGAVWTDQMGVERGVAVDAPLVLTSDDAFRQWAANRICEMQDELSVLNEKLDK